MRAIMDGIKSNKINFLKMWIAIKRLDLNDKRITTIREVSIPRGSDTQAVIQALSNAFGVTSDQVTFKMRNNQGFLIPLNNCLQTSSKNRPYVLEVVKNYQHVTPTPRTTAMIPLNKGLKMRLQSISRRIERLEELLPQIKLRHHEKINKEIELLGQKLIFLNKRMEIADSHRWRGMFTRPPLW